MNPSPEIKQKVSELLKELSKDINTENLRKAGTELELNMSRDYQLTLETRFTELKLVDFKNAIFNKNAFKRVKANISNHRNALIYRCLLSNFCVNIA